MTQVKICGLTSAQAAVDAGRADLIGLVFHPASPRAVSVTQAAGILAAVPSGVSRVALVVDADDDLLAALVALPFDLLQLHGEESPARVAEVRGRHGLPVMKAVGLRDPDDLASLAAYEGVADRLLVDAKPPRAGGLPGGNGLSFDWRLVAGRVWARPWMLAGGLTAENVGAAIAATGAPAVDVSSGVESAPGVKDRDRIAAFLAAARDQSGLRTIAASS